MDELYAPECERGILWSDPEIKISWPLDVHPVLSLKDENAPRLAQAEHNFIYGD
ncbi:dTDP-4-dehydrorhamnose 3,5-epimerase [compost metagenome]